MTPFLANASTLSIWRRAGASLALAASLAFALQPTLVLAQAVDGDNQPPPKAQPKKTKPAAKKASRTSPTDNVSDDLNRREAERAAGVVREMAATPAPATLPASNATAAPQPLVPPAAAAAAAALGATPVEVRKTTASEPPTVAAIPPRPPIVSARSRRRRPLTRRRSSRLRQRSRKLRHVRRHRHQGRRLSRSSRRPPAIRRRRR
jgi:hypothetical protein